MPTNARKAFDANAADIDRLLEIHGIIGGRDRGRRNQLEVLNKSAIVLITSIWEAYCEDVAAEAIDHIVTHSKQASSLPKEIKKSVAKELKANPNEIALWSIADKGWKQFLRDRLESMQSTRNRGLNTP